MELDKKNFRTLILTAVGCVVLYWLLHETERMMLFLKGIFHIINPFIAGACLAFVLNVPMRAIERQLRKVQGLRGHRAISILLTLILLFLVIVLVFNMLIPQLKETVMTIAGQLPGFLNRTEKMIRGFLQDNPDLMEWLAANTDIEKFDWSALTKRTLDLAGQGFTAVVNGAVSAVGGVINGIWNVFLAVVFALYCLSGKETLARQGRKLLYAFLPEKWADHTVRVLRLSNTTFSNFFSGQCLEVVILGSLFAGTMTIFKMPYVPLVSVLVAVTAFIPVVGAWIGCVLGAFFIMVNDPVQAFWFVIMFLILQQIENNLIYPRVVGTSIGLPSMWVLVSVTVGGDLMGVLGMMLMIPFASVLYTLLRECSDNRVKLRKIDPDKLVDHPPVLKSKLKEKREVAKQKREMKKNHNFSQTIQKTESEKSESKK